MEVNQNKEENHICDYGCGKEATHFFKSVKKWCCEDSPNKCPAKKERKLTPREKPEVCDYGCGQEPKYYFPKVNKWCCSPSQNSCPSKKERARENRIGVSNKPAQPFENDENILCSFGCDQIAKYKYQSGSYCCSYDWHKCPGKHEQISEQSTKVWSDLDRRKRLSETQHKDLFAVAIPVAEDDDHVCQDCGEKAHFWFKTNNRYSCSERIEQCLVVRKEIGDRSKKLWEDEEFRNKVISSQNYEDPERRRKLSESNKKFLLEHPEELERRIKTLVDYVKSNIGKTYEEMYGEETAKRMRLENRERRLGKTNIELYGEEKALEISIKISEKNSGRKETREEVLLDMSIKKKEHWADPESSYNSKEFRDKKSEEGKQKWKDPDYVEKMQKGLHNCPNGPERTLIEIFKNLNLDYEFVGDWKLNIDGRNPDFINRKTNKLIEHFGIYYHDTIVNISREEHEKERIDHFSNNGYKTLIIWEDELKDIPKVIEKILAFDKE